MVTLLQSTATRIPRLQHIKFSTASKSQLNTAELDAWIASPKSLTITDRIHSEHLADLYVTLPTQDGSLDASHPPIGLPAKGSLLGYGHHLAFFHPRNPESNLRTDGTDTEFCPPEPFTRRMWAGGKMVWKEGERLKVGDKVRAVSRIESVEKKGFEGEGGNGTPMVFVKQMIEYKRVGSEEVAIEEERAHVYLAAPANRKGPRKVDGLPTPNFSLEYFPSATTLFRFSALTFNGHYIHLDKEYAFSEGYPERLVHGPLTALMLLEATVFHNPGVKLKTFEYRAHNPLVVNQKVGIYGAFEGKNTIRVWATSEDGVVGMTGMIML